jgi:hypothetical protein
MLLSNLEFFSEPAPPQARVWLYKDYTDLQSSCKSELLQSSLKPSARLGAFRRKSAGKSFPPNFAEVAECRRKKQKTFPGLRHRVARRAPGQAEFFSDFGCLSQLNWVGGKLP